MMNSFYEYGEIWVNHYSSNHQILLVGEGDFSFSVSLALSFGSAFNLVASSLDSYGNLSFTCYDNHQSTKPIFVWVNQSFRFPEVVLKKYKKAESNLKILSDLGALVLHRVDVTTMKLHPDLQMRKFDRIVYNFPHAGFMGMESDQRVIRMHKSLVHGFFKNASRMLRADGEVHITHKIESPYHLWDIENLAAQHCLALLKRVTFNIKDYPGYENKRGDGRRSDEPFRLGDCATFIFVLSSRSTSWAHKVSLQRVHGNINSGECYRIFREYFDHAILTFGQADKHLVYSAENMLRIGYERYMAENGGNSVSGYIFLLEELQNLSRQRVEFLQNRLVEIEKQLGFSVWVCLGPNSGKV